MRFSHKTQYIQIYRESDYCAIYYDQINENFVEYRTSQNSGAYYKYILLIPIVLFINRITDNYFQTILATYGSVKNICLILAVVLTYVVSVEIGYYIDRTIKVKGRIRLSLNVEEKYVEKGKMQLKQQEVIAFFMLVFALVLMGLFYIFNKFILWVLAEILLVCFVGTIQSVHPISRKHYYSQFNK
ncbi:MAG: hypothetical protein PHQ72_12460 [Hespellia sp.]|nr:hypothetical protein [Hespellia sp.]